MFIWGKLSNLTPNKGNCLRNQTIDARQFLVLQDKDWEYLNIPSKFHFSRAPPGLNWIQICFRITYLTKYIN